MRRFGLGISLATALAVVAVCRCAFPAAAEHTAATYNAQGVDRYNAGEWSSAVDLFTRALRLEPQSEVIRKNLANTYQAQAGDLSRKGQYDSAIRLLERAIQVDSHNPHPLIQLGAYYLHEGLVVDAIYRLEEAIELAPEDVDAHYLLGEAYYKDNDAAAAGRQWDWVLKLDPDRVGLAERRLTAAREERVEADFGGRASRHFNVTYSREAEGRLVRDVLGILEDAYREVGRALNSAYPPAPIQVSLYTLDGFSETTQMSGHIGAVYDGSKIRCPVIDEAGNQIPLDELRRRLYHEYVHVVVRHIAKDNVPWWLNEGLAESFARELTSQEKRFLRRARNQDLLFSLRDLSDSQLERLEMDALTLAYKQSHATVAHLKARFGTRRFGSLLESLAEGASVEEALRRTFRYTYRTLELAVADSMESG